MPTLVPAGQLPADREVWRNAVVLIDKPQTWTSFDVCNKLKFALRAKKVGHAGTLDPMATGLLCVCIGKGTKAAETFQGYNKVYTGTIRLGEGTASYDADEPVEEELPWEHLTDAEIGAAAEEFVGEILQAPPVFSALKVDGERLYKKARRGERVEVKKRAVTVFAFEVARAEPGGQDLRFRVACSKGTYVRSLAHDLGRRLGTVAHLTALRREQNGDQHVSQAWNLNELVTAYKAQQQQQQEAAAEAGGDH